MEREPLGRNYSDPHHAPERACAGIESELFFTDDREQIRAAQRVCEHCPVLARCAAWALRCDFTDGVVASVPMPALNADRRVKRTARARLEFVAATGVPSLRWGLQGTEAA
ncbi:WhiB family transcriptional regulator [Nocardia puris]|uniref:WhiB family transcriptional regulator n=1 Tax=Nocardia puris TaxID=208602 RepID=UPI001894A865|nr:WhiB family transcriptional regulator [Nocardia puris]MBF6212246.1 WhiB family transcriptional regulator [Nocardia puris]MBF6370148.1 WhiB family transcriptional regulator [Nocardia puris]MBF6460835.1 WhiB family transcriptional regulator [Nocardia puris]